MLFYFQMAKLKGLRILTAFSVVSWKLTLAFRKLQHMETCLFLFLKINFYWNTAIPIWLHITFGEQWLIWMSPCDRELRTCMSKIFIIVFQNDLWNRPRLEKYPSCLSYNWNISTYQGTVQSAQKLYLRKNRKLPFD